jgi:hypothetical protein
MPHPNSSTGKKVRIDHVTIEYRLKGGEWTREGWTGLSMAGIVLKSDGTEGKATWGGGVHYDWAKMPEYAWLRQLSEAMQPEGVPVLPFRLTGIENDDLEADRG